jgi:hypothetical protein
MTGVVVIAGAAQGATKNTTKSAVFFTKIRNSKCVRSIALNSL